MAVLTAAAALALQGCDRGPSDRPTPEAGPPADLTPAAASLASRDPALKAGLDRAVRREGSDPARREAAALAEMTAGLDARAASAPDGLAVERGRRILAAMTKARADADCAAMLRGDPAAISRHVDADAERRWMERVLIAEPEGDRRAGVDAADGTITCTAARGVLRDALSGSEGGAADALRRLGTTSHAPVPNRPILKSGGAR